MMSRGRGHIFDDPTKLNEMLSLRRQGVSTLMLGERYGVDHSTIVYHAKRYGVKAPKGVRMEVIRVDSIVGPILARRPAVVVSNAQARIITDFDGTVINKGKTYAEYVAESKRIAQLKKYGHPLLPESKQDQP